MILTRIKQEVQIFLEFLLLRHFIFQEVLPLFFVPITADNRQAVTLLCTNNDDISCHHSCLYDMMGRK
jgi:hypothetical protein